jgi:Uma2 family endonuclease
MSVETIPRPVTVEEFFAVIEDGQKADLLEGSIYMASPDTPRNDKLGYFIRALIQDYADERQLGEAYGSRVAFVLGRYRCPEPDVSFVAIERLGVMEGTRGIGAPDIAVEIVSADSASRDYVQKRILYEEAGVREYWIVDPQERRCQFLRLISAQFVEVTLEGGNLYRSEVLPDFWLDVGWLFAQPLPKPSACLRAILTTDRSR